jgi:hypothetical protein
MTQFSRIGLDTSKSVFTLHCVDAAGKPLLRVSLLEGLVLHRFTAVRFAEPEFPKHRGYIRDFDGSLLGRI